MSSDQTERLRGMALAGPGRFGRGRRAVARLARAGTAEAARALAEVYVGAGDGQVHDAAAAALAALTGQPAIDAVCELAITTGDERLLDLLDRAGHRPWDPARRALWLLLAGRFGQAAELDYDGSLVRAASRTSGADLRRRIAEQARAAGRVQWVRAAATGTGRDLGELSDEEWQATADVLAAAGRWEEIWRLARHAPLRWAAKLLNTLAGHRWQPEAETDREGYAELIALAGRCTTPPSVTSLFRRKQVLANRVDLDTYLAVSAGGALLAAAEYDSERIRLWRLPSGEQAGEFPVPGLAYESLAIAPDGRTIAFGDSEVRLLPVTAGGVAASWEYGWGKCSQLTFTPDGELLVCWEILGHVEVREVPSGRLLWSVRAHQGGGLGLAMAADARLLATVGLLGRYPHHRSQVRLWQLTTGAPAGAIDPPAPRDRVGTLLVTPDGRRLVTKCTSLRSGDSMVLWDLPSRTPIMEHGIVPGSPVVMSPDGRHVITVHEWDTAGGHARSGAEVRSTTDGALVASIDWSDLALGSALDGRWQGGTLTVSPDGRLLIGSGYEASPVQAWHLPSGESAGTLPGHDEGAETLLLVPGSGTVVAVTGHNRYAGDARDPEDGRLLMWRAERALTGHAPAGEVTPAEAQRLRDRTRGGADAAWGELLAALVHWRHRHDVELTGTPPIQSTTDIEVT